METKNIIEALLATSLDKDHIRKALRLCRIINDKDRNWHAKVRPELDSYMSTFTNPSIICTIDSLITVFIISSEKAGRLYRVLTITGHNTKYETISKSKISSEIVRSLNIKDFIPDSYMKQVIYIPRSKINYDCEKENMEESLLKDISEGSDENIGFYLFTEIKKNEWTIDKNITSLNLKNKTQTNAKQIIKNILSEI